MKIINFIIKYSWLLDIVTGLFKNENRLLKSKEPIKQLAIQIKEMLQDVELEGEDILKIIDILKVVKDLGSLDELHKFMLSIDSEKKDVGMLLKEFDSILKFGEFSDK